MSPPPGQVTMSPAPGQVTTRRGRAEPSTESSASSSTLALPAQRPQTPGIDRGARRPTVPTDPPGRIGSPRSSEQPAPGSSYAPRRPGYAGPPTPTPTPTQAPTPTPPPA